MTLIDENKKLWIALNLIPGVGKSTFRKLILRFGDPNKVFRSSRRELKEISGLTDKTIEEIIGFPMEKRLEKELKLIEEKLVTIITMGDPEYPRYLKHIADPPPLIYVMGELKQEDALSISIVGTRKPTWYGREITSRLSSGLANRGITVVSGMARGIDSTAHAAAMDAGGRTVAVLGNGLNTVYPPENRKLKERIQEQGALISEFVMDARPERMNFPIRNRIISGLSMGTVVVEASAKSGALITARLALEQNREVFAVPGSVSSDQSRGANSLIKEGAKLVENVEDILDELPGGLESLLKEPDEQEPPPEPELLPKEKKVFSLLHQQEEHIDIIIERSGLSAKEVAGILINLELQDLVKQLPGKSFIRIK